MAVLVQRVEDEFCTDCIYSQYVETEGKLKIRCRKKMSNKYSFYPSLNLYKALGSKACLEFTRKE